MHGVHEKQDAPVLEARGRVADRRRGGGERHGQRHHDGPPARRVGTPPQPERAHHERATDQHSERARLEVGRAEHEADGPVLSAREHHLLDRERQELAGGHGGGAGRDEDQEPAHHG